MKVILAFLLLFALISSHAQTGRISGRVLDAKTLEPLPFANVFVNHTTMGTAADEKGFFSLDRVPFGQVEIIFSFVGYQPYQTKIDLADNQRLEVTVRLVIDKTLLDNVQITGTRDREWEGKFKKFSKIFLGEGRQAGECKILNPWVLDFKEGVAQNNEILFAEASAPIIIENMSLGYQVTYFLKRFTANDKAFTIQGDVQFKEMRTLDPQLASLWEQHRLEAYNGSQRHLFISLLNGKAKKEGFLLYADKSGFEMSMKRSSLFSRELGNSVEEFNSDKIEIVPDKNPGGWVLAVKKRLEVHYQGGKTSMRTYQDLNATVSWIEFKNGYAKVNANGIVLDPENILTSGYMSNLRISDILPYDYRPGQSGGLVEETTFSVSAMRNLQEKVYVITDKPYYYPGEMIWFNGIMQYVNPLKRDSLSSILHVELINSEKKILQSKSYFIDRGNVAGDFYLSENLPAGSYYLRAYTHWMRNYENRFIFIKPVMIVDLFDKVLLPGQMTQKVHDNKIHILIEPNKESYKPREKISLTIIVKDERSGSSLSGLSISVLDMKQVVSIPPDGPFEGFSGFDEVAEPEAKMTYPIEYGISLSGEFINDKGKNERAWVTLIQGNREDFTTVETDDQGKFWVSGFQFIDTVEFAMQAKNRKGKRSGKVMIRDQDPPSIEKLPNSISLPLKRELSSQRFKMEYALLSPGRILEAVTIQSTRLENTSDAKRYANPDHTVSREWLEQQKSGTLLTALQSKVPGLIVYPYLQNGMVRYTIRFGLSLRNEQPILVIDGQPYVGSDGVAQLTQINPSTIDHVDIIRSNAALQFGARGNGGAIVVYTKNGTPNKDPKASMSFDKRFFQLMKLMGYSTPLNFKSPDYGNKDEDHSQPDFRSTIYWQPHVTTNEKDEAYATFFVADLPTQYKIIVAGITSEGIPFQAERIVEVK